MIRSRITPRGRQELLRMMLRLAGEYGQATAELALLEESPAPKTNGAKVERLKAQVWKYGCFAGWTQVKTLFDTGELIDPQENPSCFEKRRPYAI